MARRAQEDAIEKLTFMGVDLAFGSSVPSVAVTFADVFGKALVQFADSMKRLADSIQYGLFESRLLVADLDFANQEKLDCGNVSRMRLLGLVVFQGSKIEWAPGMTREEALAAWSMYNRIKK